MELQRTNTNGSDGSSAENLIHTNLLRIKNIPPELRKTKYDFKNDKSFITRIIQRLKTDSQFLRSVIQIIFLLLCIWIGIEFYLFMKWGSSGGQSLFHERPPGVEGFLPISALMSLKYWLQTGIINNIHPSGLFIFIAIIAGGLLLKKSFCGWLCPVGTISESLWMLGRKIFGKNLNLNRWLDYPLRSIKYFLLFFFVYSIWQMDTSSLFEFINSPYNKVADIKMFLFFSNITSFALWTIIILMMFSLFIQNFWCRYLCPYGALLGAISWLSPTKITRNKTTCIDCELCTKACPSNIKVHKVKKVWSDECMNCLACVQACPVKNTLDIRTPITKTRVPNLIFGILIIGVFIAITGLAMITDHWHNQISKDEYLKRFKELETPLYQHNQGQVPKYGPND
ncbi:MAG: 4Fe-4S binding protein [Ignavibacteriales bacterium]|nr:4Fe-4S binding protein [Ignavibacteriales bacterium]